MKIDEKDNRVPVLRANAWQKGQSGNAGGVSKALREVRDALKKLHPQCAVALEGMVANWQEDPRSAIEAIKIIYARSIGKERESLYTPKDRSAALGAIEAVDIKKLPDAALDELDAVLRKYAT